MCIHFMRKRRENVTKGKEKQNGRFVVEATGRFIADIVNCPMAIYGHERSSCRVMARVSFKVAEVKPVETGRPRPETVVLSLEIPPPGLRGLKLGGCRSLLLLWSPPSTTYHRASSSACQPKRSYFHVSLKDNVLHGRHPATGKKCNLLLCKAQTQHWAK